MAILKGMATALAFSTFDNWDEFDDNGDVGDVGDDLSFYFLEKEMNKIINNAMEHLKLVSNHQQKSTTLPNFDFLECRLKNNRNC